MKRLNPLTSRTLKIEKISKFGIRKIGLAQKGLRILGLSEGEFTFPKPSDSVQCGERLFIPLYDRSIKKGNERARFGSIY
jgi:hypothetical protein